MLVERDQLGHFLSSFDGAGEAWRSAGHGESA
jgi:hypothetical protein